MNRVSSLSSVFSDVLKNESKELTADVLVNVTSLPDLYPVLEMLKGRNLIVRKMKALESEILQGFLRSFTSRYKLDPPPRGDWSHVPSTYFMAFNQWNECVGAAGINAIGVGVVWPVAVNEEHRRRGIGFALLLACFDFASSFHHSNVIVPDVPEGVRRWFLRKDVNMLVLPTFMRSELLTNLLKPPEKPKNSIGQKLKLKRKASNSSSNSSASSSTINSGHRKRDRMKSKFRRNKNTPVVGAECEENNTSTNKKTVHAGTFD